MKEEILIKEEKWNPLHVGGAIETNSTWIQQGRISVRVIWQTGPIVMNEEVMGIEFSHFK